VKLEPFRQWEGVAAPMLRPNIDTDVIIPSREMKRVSKEGLGEGLFAGERYLEAGGRDPDPEFVLNRPAYAGSTVLLGGSNFGCGSSREHAVWALKEYGIRAIVAAGFGSIFRNNCVRNGLLPVQLEMPVIEAIAAWVEQAPQDHRLRLDLEAQTVTAGDAVHDFDIDPGAKYMLLNGLDPIALTLEHWPAIEAFHQRRRATRPWLYGQRQS
jgi:3-isopropylmalate/(R)-2-methylmalate dehydratase small subunit